mgnify:CR=1 FL=1
MKSAAMGLALGRLMTGLSVKDVGQRFQALFDANLPAAIAPTPGPYFNRPANISALNDVVSRPTNNTAPVVANNYYQSVYRPRLDAQLDYIKMMNRNNSKKDLRSALQGLTQQRRLIQIVLNRKLLCWRTDLILVKK